MSRQPSPGCTPPDAVAAAATDPAEDPRLTQALEEYLAALEAGQCPSRQQFLARYPDIADRLADHLEGLDFLHTTAASMQAGDGLPPGGPAPCLEDFQVVREVGRGGMGIVYEAVQRSLQRRVALKVLSLGATLDPRHLQRFKNEAQAAAQLQHPNIVPVYTVGCERGVHYYAMRFIEGEPLTAFIEQRRRGTAASPCQAPSTGRGLANPTDGQAGVPGSGPARTPASPGSITAAASGAARPDAQTACRPSVLDGGSCRRVAWLGVQAAEALEHAHQQGVIHRDVKPGNLLLDGRGQLWVADFGLARWPADDALTRTGDLLGTLRYMSPEQASARRGLVDHRTDVYSLGATLYELLTLRPVCDGRDHQELLHQILHEEPVPPRRLCPDVPRDLETVLLKALGKQVEERYATAQELADDLRRFLEGRPVLARRPGLWERAGKWARRHRPVVAAAAVLLVLSVVALTAGTIVIGAEQAKARAAYELEAAARSKEAEARARAEQNFQQAQRLLDYIAEIAAVDMASDSELPHVRRKLLQAALAYYEDFLEQQKDNRLTREELLRGHARVAAILDAVGRPKEARVAWDQTFQLALAIGDGGQAQFRLVPADNKLRLLRLAAVQEDLKLSPEQVRAVLDLEAKRQKRSRDRPPPAGEAPASREPEQGGEKDVEKLLNPEQARRLGQLLRQQRGVGAFRDDAVKAALALTPEQRKAVAAIQEEAQAARGQPGAAPEHGKQPTLDRMLALLTPEQTARWRELVGEPFRGILPPRELVLSVGKMTLEIAPPRGPRERDKGTATRPLPSDEHAP
jgi:serine/threonine protein kinase